MWTLSWHSNNDDFIYVSIIKYVRYIDHCWSAADSCMLIRWYTFPPADVHFLANVYERIHSPLCMHIIIDDDDEEEKNRLDRFSQTCIDLLELIFHFQHFIHYLYAYLYSKFPFQVIFSVNLLLQISYI